MTRKHCCGTMFPDALYFRINEPQAGKVLAYQLDRAGGMSSIRSNRKVSASIEEWDDCVKCPEFEHCYKLCVGKIALKSVIVAE